MLETQVRTEIMANLGRKDRALLKSNPSARTEAGTGMGAAPLWAAPVSPLPVLALKAENFGDLGAEPHMRLLCVRRIFVFAPVFCLPGFTADPLSPPNPQRIL